MLNKINSMIKPGIFTTALIMLFFTQAYSNPDQVIDLPLVVVNGDTILSSNIDQLIMKTHNNLSDKQSFDYEKLLTKSIHDLMMLQEAYNLGLDDNEYLQNTINNKRKELIRKLYLSHAFKPEIVISDKEVADFFEENLIRYQFRSISLATPEEAQDVYKLLQDGESFAKLATERSLDHRRMKNGIHMVTFKMNVEDDLLKLSQTLKVGEYSKPIPYKEFYSIMKLEKLMPADTEKYDTFKENIVDRLTEEQKEIAWYKFMDELLIKYPISVDSAVLMNINADKDIVLRMEFRDGTEKPVLIINDEHYISDNELRTKISQNIMNAGTTPYEIILVNTINQKQEELLSSYSAVQNGYWDSTRVVNWYYNELDSSMIEIYLKEMIVSKIAFNTEEFETYYNENIEGFRRPDQFILDHMMIKGHDESHDAATALKDGAQWSYIYKKYDAVSEDAIENTTWMSIDKFLDEVKDELYGLSIGQTSASFTVAEGFVIFKIKDRKQGEFKSIKEVDMEIREVMFQRKFNQLLDEHLNKLKENSNIVYIQENIDSYFGKKK